MTRSDWRAGIGTAAACVLAAGASTADAQTAYLSALGLFGSAGDRHDFDFTTTAPLVRGTDTAVFRTYQFDGGTMPGGIVVQPGGIDSAMTLLNDLGQQGAFSDDGFEDFSGGTDVPRDSRITYAADQFTSLFGESGFSDPLPADGYTVNLQAWDDLETGEWATSLELPADKATFTGLSPVGNSVVGVIALGTDGPATGGSAQRARLNQSGTLETFDLAVAPTGKATLSNTGTLTVQGRLDVGVGGLVFLNGGTMNLLGDLDLNDGVFERDAGFGASTLASSSSFVDWQIRNAGRFTWIGATGDTASGDFNWIGDASKIMNITGAFSRFEQLGRGGEPSDFTVDGGAGLFVDDGGKLDVERLVIDGGSFIEVSDTGSTLDTLADGNVRDIQINHGRVSAFNGAVADLANGFADPGLELGRSGDATLEVFDAGSVLEVNGFSTPESDTEGVVSIDVGDGGRLTQANGGAGPMVLGRSLFRLGSDGFGPIEIDRPAATLRVTNAGFAELNAANHRVRPTGEIDVNNATLTAAGNLAFEDDPQGDFFDPGGKLTVNDGTVRVGNTLTFEQNAAANLTGNWSVEADAIDFQGNGGFRGGSNNTIQDFLDAGMGTGTFRFNTVLGINGGNGTTYLPGDAVLGVDTIGTDRTAVISVTGFNLLELGGDLVVGEDRDATVNLGQPTTDDNAGLRLGRGTNTAAGNGKLFVGTPAVNDGGTTHPGAIGTVNVERDGNLEAPGGIEVRRGSLKVDGGSLETFGQNISVAAGSSLTLADFANINDGSGATLRNEGTLNADENPFLRVELVNAGTLNLGNDLVTLRVDDFTQEAGGVLTLGVGTDPFQGSFSALSTIRADRDDVTLAGELRFVADDPADPGNPLVEYASIQPYDFGAEILSADEQLFGTFDTVTGLILGDGTALAVTYGGSVVVTRALLGDADLDQQIAQGDLNAVLNNWGQNNLTNPNADISWATGDFNGDGRVAQADLNAVLNNWGDQFNAPDFSGFAIPEPAAMTATLLGLMVLRSRRSGR
ncbi:MAG: hypothetical protein AAGH92_02835 [Planctomycetota bacterium]